VRASFCVSNVGTIVSSSACGVVLVLGTADGASAWANDAVGVAWIEKATHKPPKVPQSDFIRKSESANSTDKSMLLQELMHFFGQLSADTFRGGNFIHRRLTQAIHRAELSQQQILAVLAHARAIVKNAFADPFFHQ
jgi:hypothetical protein